jgi:hypothetical protein
MRQYSAASPRKNQQLPIIARWIHSRIMHRLVLRPLLGLLLTLSALLGAMPAVAAVTITFWSHELGSSFPHAFFTLRGVPDAGGAPVDANYGFTAKAITPKLLMGTVGGRLDIAKPGYVNTSDAQFSVVLTDAQYGRVLALIAAWDDKTGDSHYNLTNRNCIHFVKEAARIVGLSVLDQPTLMKKPRSYLQAVEAANAGAVTPVGRRGKDYLASLPPLTPMAVPAAPAALAVAVH